MTIFLLVLPLMACGALCLDIITASRPSTYYRGAKDIKARVVGYNILN
jgi:hypothetical protein